MGTIEASQKTVARSAEAVDRNGIVRLAATLVSAAAGVR
jgi:hypothetical protein